MKSDLATPSLWWAQKYSDTPILIKCRKYRGFQAAVNSPSVPSWTIMIRTDNPSDL